MSSLRIEELLRKSLLGQELINTQFHLFSRRSRTTGRVVDCRVLCANNVLLTESAKYFLDLLSSDLDPSDPTLSNVVENDEILSGIPIDDYGYESDSDLDDDESVSTESSTVASKRDNEPSEGSDAGAVVVDEVKPDPNTPETATIPNIAGTPTRSVSTVKGNSTRLQLIESRHILVKDTAFQTWYALLNYLYTGKVAFRSPKSLSGHSQASSLSTTDQPRCSAKSMYRLACKLGIDPLRDLAFANIRSNLTEHNVLTELVSTFTSRFHPIVQMELDFLYEHVASYTIVAGLPILVRRIANKELPRGADIINGLLARIILAHYPRAAAITGPPYSVFSEKDPSSAQDILQYQSITAMLAYRDTSLEELRVQHYRRDHGLFGALCQPSFAAPAPQLTSVLGTQQPFTGLLSDENTATTSAECSGSISRCAIPVSPRAFPESSSESLNNPVDSVPVAERVHCESTNLGGARPKTKKKK